MSQYIGVPKSSILHFDELVTITVLHYEISKSLWNTNFLFIGLIFLFHPISLIFPSTGAAVKFNIKYLVTK